MILVEHTPMTIGELYCWYYYFFCCPLVIVEIKDVGKKRKRNKQIMAYSMTFNASKRNGTAISEIMNEIKRLLVLKDGYCRFC